MVDAGGVHVERALTRSKQHRKTNVGAGLLAKAVYQSMYLVTDTPPSRASPLPHGVRASLD